MQQHGLDGDWARYRAQPRATVTPPPSQPQGWKPDPQEAMRALNRVILDTINGLPKENNFGIDSLEFEVVKHEPTSGGLKITLEGHGYAHAKHAEHIRRKLETVAQYAKKPLLEQGIRLDILYNNLQTWDGDESENESTLDSPIGLVHRFEFSVQAVASVSLRKTTTSA